MLEIKKLHKKFGKKEVLKGIDITIKDVPNKLVHFQGANNRLV